MVTPGWPCHNRTSVKATSEHTLKTNFNLQLTLETGINLQRDGHSILVDALEVFKA